MTWQTILYFTSILVTIGLTGFLAWYAWRLRQTAGARTFMWLMVCDCAMALSEALSMLSQTKTQALFWFDMRFLPAGLINVLWLIFALEYTGRKAWLSKRLIAALFVIPFITQVMVSTNSMHGLWVRQNVGFHQNGPFWIAETSARILGPWFIVHLFYGYIFLLTGSVLIIIAAWRLRRLYRGQAFLLAAGTFTPFLVSLIPTFNLNPQAEFNPFVQGLGLGALLIAAAVFRFEFLKKAPAEEAGQTRLMATQEKRSLALFLFIFTLMVTGIAATGYVSYQNYERQFRMQVERQLSAIAELKVGELVNWRSEQLGDAMTLYRNPAFAALVQRFLENPADAQAQPQLQAWLDAIQSNYGYNSALLLDTRGVVRIFAPVKPEPVTAYMEVQTAATLAGTQVTFLDFHRDTADGPIHLSLLIPIFAGQDTNRPLGVLGLRIDPNVYLYPFINQWPAPSTTAETLLVRRDGEDVVYLNKIRFDQNAALNLRFPLTRTDMPAVKAVLGQTGIVEGIDYRGLPVVAYLRAVPDSPWFLVAKMDSAEVYAPLRARAWDSVIFFGALIIAAATGLVLVWRQQRLRYYRAQAEAAEMLRVNAEKLRILFEILPVGVSVLDGERKIAYSNPALHKILHITQEGLDKGDYRTREYLRTDGTPMPAEEFASMRAAAEQKAIHNVETCVVREDGEKIWTDVSAIPTPFSDWKVLIVTADITERKWAEQQLAQYSEHLEEMVNERTHELRETQEQLVRQERLATLGQMAGSVGHELRNPLAVISNAVYYLKLIQPDVDHKVKEYLNIVEKETLTADKIVTDLLDFTRIKSVERVPVAVSELVRQTLARFPALPPVEVVLELPADLPPVYADPRQMTQVLGNLTVNACQAMPTGGKLTLLAHRQEQMVAIAVKDSGVGIPPENMSKLFEPLFTTKLKGIGLGLAVSKKLAEANGGRIEVESEPGKGSTFSVYLPVYKE